jgi:hypothetical protein
MDSTLDFDKYYIFNEETLIGPMAVAPINNKDVPTEARKRFFLGDFSMMKPDKFVQVRGKKMCDLIVAGAPSFYLISERIILALKQNEVTGWGSYPVVITTDSMQDIGNYHAFYVTGKAEKADRSLSEKIEVVLPNKSKAVKDKGYYFPLNTWEGTDFFYHIGTLGKITVTKKVKVLFESMNVTNVEFRKCSEYIWA